MFIENSGRYESEIAYLLWNGYGSMWRRKQMSLFDWSCDEMTKFVFWQIWVETNKPWRPLNRFTAAGDRNDQINGQMTLRGKGGQINMQYIFTLDKQLLVLQRSKLAYAVLPQPSNTKAFTKLCSPLIEALCLKMLLWDISESCYTNGESRKVSAGSSTTKEVY